MGYKHQIRNVKDYIRLPFCYNHWYVAGLAEEFGQQPVSKTLLERSVVFYRTETGNLVAFAICDGDFSGKRQELHVTPDLQWSSTRAASQWTRKRMGTSAC